MLGHVGTCWDMWGHVVGAWLGLSQQVWGQGLPEVWGHAGTCGDMWGQVGGSQGHPGATRSRQGQSQFHVIAFAPLSGMGLFVRRLACSSQGSSRNSFLVLALTREVASSHNMASHGQSQALELLGLIYIEGPNPETQCALLFLDNALGHKWKCFDPASLVAPLQGDDRFPLYDITIIPESFVITKAVPKGEITSKAEVEMLLEIGGDALASSGDESGKDSEHDSVVVCSSESESSVASEDSMSLP